MNVPGVIAAASRSLAPIAIDSARSSMEAAQISERSAITATAAATESSVGQATTGLALTSTPVKTAAISDATSGAKRVLIFTFDTTGGHLALARAIEQDIHRVDPAAVVAVVNGYDGNKFLSRPLVQDAMRTVDFVHSTYTPVFKRTLTKLWSTNQPFIRANRRLRATSVKPQIAQRIETFRPDVVVSTHPSITAALGEMRLDGSLRKPAVAALADMNPHGLWIAPGIDQHIVNNEADLERLPKVFAAPTSTPLNMTVAAPPVDPRSTANYDVATVRKSFGLPTNGKVLLMSGGSLGLPFRDADVRAILDNTDMHIAVAVAKNQRLQRHIVQTFPADRVTAIPFTKDMPALIATSDVALLQANGATSFEAFAAGTPVVFYRLVPGAERSTRAADQAGLGTSTDIQTDMVHALQAVERGDSTVHQHVEAGHALFRNKPSYGDVILSTQLAQ